MDMPEVLSGTRGLFASMVDYNVIDEKEQLEETDVSVYRILHMSFTSSNNYNDTVNMSKIPLWWI